MEVPTAVIPIPTGRRKLHPQFLEIVIQILINQILNFHQFRRLPRKPIIFRRVGEAVLRRRLSELKKAGVGEREHNRGVVVMEVIISSLPEAEVDRTLVAAQRQGGAGGLKPRELLHQVPEIGGAGVKQRRRCLPGSSGAASGLGNGVSVSIGAVVGRGGGG